MCELNPRAYAMQAQMMLMSPSVNVCLIGPPDERIRSHRGSFTQIIVPDSQLLHCIEILSKLPSHQLRHADQWQPALHRSYVFYRSETAWPSRSVFQSCKASEFIALDARTYHLNVISFDVSARRFAGSRNAPFLQSLDLSRLEIDDSVVCELIHAGSFQNLQRLDLSGNAFIGITSVEAICERVSAGKFPHLKWLNLLGTDCDATPYVDGHYWRIADIARPLACRFGYQKWMMLGSRLPEMANVEVLTGSQRQSLRGWG